MDPGFTYRHTTGLTDGGARVLAIFRACHRTIEPANISVRLFEPIAVLSADHRVTIHELNSTARIVPLAVTQVWRLTPAGWRAAAQYNGLLAEG
jgi:hypothetical protein